MEELGYTEQEFAAKLAGHDLLIGMVLKAPVGVPLKRISC